MRRPRANRRPENRSEWVSAPSGGCHESSVIGGLRPPADNDEAVRGDLLLREELRELSEFCSPRLSQADDEYDAVRALCQGQCVRPVVERRTIEEHPVREPLSIADERISCLARHMGRRGETWVLGQYPEAGGQAIGLRECLGERGMAGNHSRHSSRRREPECVAQRRAPRVGLDQNDTPIHCRQRRRQVERCRRLAVRWRSPGDENRLLATSISASGKRAPQATESVDRPACELRGSQGTAPAEGLASLFDRNAGENRDPVPPQVLLPTDACIEEVRAEYGSDTEDERRNEGGRDAENWARGGRG